MTNKRKTISEDKNIEHQVISGVFGNPINVNVFVNNQKETTKGEKNYGKKRV